MTDLDRLAAALHQRPHNRNSRNLAREIFAADPTIAADMEMGRRIRDANDPLLLNTLRRYDSKTTQGEADYIRAALTEGEKP